MHCLTQHKNVVAAAPAQAVADGRLAAVVLRRVDHEHAAAHGRVDRARHRLVRRALGAAETQARDGDCCRGLGHDCQRRQPHVQPSVTAQKRYHCSTHSGLVPRYWTSSLMSQLATHMITQIACAADTYTAKVSPPYIIPNT